MFAAVFFLPDQGVLWSSTSSGSILGVQLLGWAAVSVWILVISWIYLFSLKRCRLLKLKREQELLG
jgi:ammonia channel protein AmtB